MFEELGIYSKFDVSEGGEQVLDKTVQLHLRALHLLRGTVDFYLVFGMCDIYVYLK